MSNRDTALPRINAPTDPSAPADAPPNARAGRTRWKIFLVLLLVGTISYVDRASISLGLPLITKEFGLTPEQQGLLLSAFFWTYAFFQIPGGAMADKYGPRKVIGFVMLLWAVFQTLIGFAQGLVMLMLMRIGLGAAEAPQFPAGGKLNALWLPESERARGAVLMNSSASLGAAFGGLLVGGLIAWFGGWREAFIAVGILTLAVGAFAYWYLRDRPQEHPGVSPGELEYIETEHAIEDARDAELLTQKRSVLHYLRFRSFWAMGMGWLSGNLVFYGLLTFGPLYLFQVRGLDLKELSWAIFVMFGAGFLGENFAGWWAQKWRARGGKPNTVMRTILGVSGIVTTLSVLGVALVPNAYVAVGLLASTLFFLRFEGLYWSLPATLTDRGRAGILGGMMNLFSNIGGIAVPLIIGGIVALTGSYFLGLMFFVACGVMYLISSLVIDYSRKLPV